jgi:hypothetical protein
MNSINFKTNSNNKVNCKYFTALVAKSNVVYNEGTMYRISIGHLFVKYALLLKIENIYLNELNDLFTYCDSEMSAVDMINELVIIYDVKNINSTVFVRLLFKTTDMNLSNYKPVRHY